MEAIPQEELQRAFDQNQKDQLDHKIREDEENRQELSQVNNVYQEIINVSNQRQSSDNKMIEVDEGTPPPEPDRSSRSRGRSKSRFRGADPELRKKLKRRILIQRKHYRATSPSQQRFDVRGAEFKRARSRSDDGRLSSSSSDDRSRSSTGSYQPPSKSRKADGGEDTVFL